MVAPLTQQTQYNAKPEKSTNAHKTTAALTLPFFEDFTKVSTWPDNQKWVDAQVYINNTMGVQPISRGVATFDGLNASGIPYEPNNVNALVYADSLTSKDFDLSANTPADSIYFSFFYQPQGFGFSPETQDSLMLYFKKKNQAWVKVWGKQGTPLDTFKQVLVPLTDTLYLHDTFQFRFVNKASVNTNDDVWNIDYIRIGAGRTVNDTLINDATLNIQPTYMLNDYTYMTYKQFLADPNKERASQHSAFIRNNYSNAINLSYSYRARVKSTGVGLFSAGTNNTNVPAYGTTTITFPTYTNTIPFINPRDNYIFENKYYIESLNPQDNKDNDTIVLDQEFYNFLAYDDWTAEKSYYLNLFPTLPGKTAIEFHLNEPDTITGVQIYFGRQVPMAYAKYFSVAIYRNIGLSGGSDQIAYQQDFLFPQYLRNDFYWTYKFDQPVALPAGTFYIGTIQPALANSDSLYIGLDANRQGANHLYYNVVGYWQPSTVTGALMIRPVIGPIIASGVNDVIVNKQTSFGISPNPAQDYVTVRFDDYKPAQYLLSDVHGKVLMEGKVLSGQKLDIRHLQPGIYLMRILSDDKRIAPQKIIKY
ncbi:hypothetical protein CAP35_10135 [Chitinophagaceae bacterium IBVUCB1]|nr:hypothetical protein CAP35_10135 [Chitinophagaceae bacterium IBVUCB1]